MAGRIRVLCVRRGFAGTSAVRRFTSCLLVVAACVALSVASLSARASDGRDVAGGFFNWYEGELIVRGQNDDELPLDAEVPPEPILEPVPGGILDVPLEDLFGITIESPGTLTAVQPSYTETAATPLEMTDVFPVMVPRRTPAAVTRIGAETIWHSGARSINELFDIYVPNAQVIRHNAQHPHLGFRGIISDKDDKYLLRVNSRLMNNRTQVGAFSEHYLPMLGDIHHIDVVRGPGSATYGPGAISGVVNLVTFNGLTFQGTDATVRQGFLEYFTSVEVRHGKKIDEETGVFFYYGYADYPGAPQEVSPYVFGRSFTARDGIPVVAGEPVTFDIPNDHRSYLSYGRHKAHIEYTKGNFRLWGRYTRSGEQNTPTRFFIAEDPVGGVDDPLGPGNSFDDLATEQAGYQQWTIFAGYLLELTDKINVDFAISTDSFDFERIINSGRILAHRENEWFGRVIGHWSVLEGQQLAFGYEFSHEDFGLNTARFPADTPRQGDDTAPWSTNTHSLLGEYQGQIGDLFTLFLSGRADKHRYTEWLYSPRAALVVTPNEQDTFKLIYADSVRRIEDDVLRFQFLDQGTFSDVEKMRGVELRYERQSCPHVWWAMSTFYEDTGNVSFARIGTEVEGRSRLVGQFEVWGVELEASYRTDRTHVFASHAFTKLADGSIIDPEIRQGVSAAPYGFGDDLANWANNVTKIYMVREFSPCWTASGSLRVYWDFPGAADLTAFNNSLFPNHSRGLGLSDPGYDQAFRSNVYLDFGIERKLCEKGVVRLDFYNVLGWIDMDLNKRNYINRTSEYRSEAAALALTGRFEF